MPLPGRTRTLGRVPIPEDEDEDAGVAFRLKQAFALVVIVVTANLLTFQQTLVLALVGGLAYVTPSAYAWVRQRRG